MANPEWGMRSFEQGSVAIVVRDESVIRVCFKASAELVSDSIRKEHPQAQEACQILINNSLNELSEYFRGERRSFTVPLYQDSLSFFARKVHQALVEVPFGMVVTYGELATMAGSPGAARAVGRVMSSNPFPLLVPCHRVVNANGSIGKYSAACGTATKAFLITFEKQIAATRKG